MISAMDAGRSAGTQDRAIPDSFESVAEAVNLDSMLEDVGNENPMKLDAF